VCDHLILKIKPLERILLLNYMLNMWNKNAFISNISIKISTKMP